MLISAVSSAMGSAQAAQAANATSGASGIGGIKFDLLGKTGGTQTPGETPGASSSFGDMIMRAIEQLDTTQKTADAYAQQAATGKLERVEDYLQAATESQLMTQLTVAVRNRAVEAYQEIMRMGV
jgi:flagellar hook-basal body complex protein FliE